MVGDSTLSEKEYYNAPAGLEVDRRNQYPLYPVQHDDTIYDTNQQHASHQRPPFGLSIFAFGLSVAVITAVVVGAAVGGGIGGACKSFSSGTSATTTIPVGPTITQTCTGATPLNSANLPANDSVTNYQPYAPYLIHTLVNDCTDLAYSASPYPGFRGSSYDLLCSVNYNEGDADGATGLPVATITNLFAYTIQDCLRACTFVNLYRQKAGQNVSESDVFNGADPGTYQPCRGITWRMDMAAQDTGDMLKGNGVDSGVGNCWLKNGTVGAQYTCNECVSASVVDEGIPFD